MYIANSLDSDLQPQEDNEEAKVMSLHAEESLSDIETPQHVRDGVFPRLSLPNNLSDRKTVGQINRSNMYCSLLQRPGVSHDPITSPMTDTTQQDALADKVSLYKNQSLPKDTENTGYQKQCIIIHAVNLCMYYSTTHN